MAARCVVLALLFVAAAGTDAEATKDRPVTKVVNLLKDMLKQMEKDAEEDEDIYDKIACWCETNDREKTKGIKDAEDKIETLLSFIEEYTANTARLKTEIIHLTAEVTTYTTSIEQATALRRKENAEFNESEKDLLQSIAALKDAIRVLSKHHESDDVGGAAFLQTSPLSSVATTLQREMRKHADLLQGVLTHTQRREVAFLAQAPGTSLLQSPGDYFDSDPTMAEQAYQPASGVILGILKQMKETFETNLGEIQKDEGAAQKKYETLKSEKTLQIVTAQAVIDKKTSELAHDEEKLALYKVDLTDTRATLSADEKFLMELKLKCQKNDQEWALRQKARTEEMAAVSKALAILTSDDAHALFSSTFKPEFLQKASESRLRSRASAFLKTVAKKINSPRLVMMASQIRIDAFTKVKQAIDDMIAQLVQEKSDEIKLKEFCVDDFNKNDLQTEEKEREKTDQEAKIDDLKMTIEQLAKDIEVLKADALELQKQVKKLGEDRAQETAEFETVVAEQRATQKLLASALKVLKGFYRPSASLAQKEGFKDEPEGFKKQEKQSSSGVMGLLQQIINDTKNMEAEAIRDEQDAQKAYMDLVKETGASIEAKIKDITNKTESKAKTEADLVDAEKALDDIELELEELGNTKLQLHQTCDFVLKNFDARQAARSDEIEGLKTAKAILSGANFESFLEDPNA